MSRSRKHTTHGNDVKYDLTELDPEDHSDHRTDSRNIQQLDQYIFPFRQDHIIHTVTGGDRRSDPVIRSKNFLHQFPIDKVSSHQKNQSAEKC